MTKSTPTLAPPPTSPTVLSGLFNLRSKKNYTRIVHFISHLILLAGSLFMVVPFIWMLSTSFKSPGKTFVFPPQWIPNPFVFSNYTDMWTALPFGTFFLNSVKIASLATIGQLIACSISAFAFSVIVFN